MKNLEFRVNYNIHRPEGVYERRLRTRNELLKARGLDRIPWADNSGIYPEEFTSWRLQYAEDSERLGINLISVKDRAGIIRPDLTKPGWATLKECIGGKVVEKLEEKGADKIVVGISGDLDSSALVALLAEYIRDNQLPHTIEAFYLKKEYHPARKRRIAELIDYLNRGTDGKSENGENLIYSDNGGGGDWNRKIVNLRVFDMNYAFKLILNSLVSSNGQFSFPSNEDALQALRLITEVTSETVNGLGKPGSSALKRSRKKTGIAEYDPEIDGLIEDIKSGKTDVDVPSDQLVNLISKLVDGNGELFDSIRRKIDPREESNLIHEMFVLLRGYLARQNGKVLTLGGQQFSELAIENYTTADTLIDDIPLANVPKTILAAAFKEYILNSSGGINIDFWEARPLQYLVPFYPCDLRIEEAEGKRIIRRSPNYLPNIVQADIEISISAIPDEIWQGIRAVEGKNYIEIDGRIHWYIDSFLHYFMIHDLSDTSVEELSKQFPNNETDILFTAVLMAAAMDKKGKKISSMLQTVTSDRQSI